MKIQDMLPTEAQIQKFQSIESALISRRTKGSIAGLGALFSALVQIIILIIQKDVFKNINSFRDLITNALFLPTVLMLLGLLLYFIYRRTSILFKESREPFRYTFQVAPITAILTNKDKNSDTVKIDLFENFMLKKEVRLGLLHHDLTELINQRIKRFSILADDEIKKDEVNPDKSHITDSRNSSHIYIYGYYAIREDKKNDEWIIHVMPYVRIGTKGAPARLAQTVRFRLADDTPDVLDTEEYNQLLESVYSRITTEIYAQIEKDIQNKISLFPTSYLRANALYIEAQDFANSNTINAIDSAIKLFKQALQEIESTFTNEFLLKGRVGGRLFISHLHQYARIQLGYAKCLIVKNRTEAQLGRKLTPVFGIRHDLKPVMERLEFYYNGVNSKSPSANYINDKKTFSILNFLSYPADTWIRKAKFKPSKALFLETSNILFQAYVTHAITDSLLNAFISSRKYLDKAKAMNPDLCKTDVFYLIAEGCCEPNVEKAIIFFRRATELDQNSQIAQYLLAYWTETRFLLDGNFKAENAYNVLKEYDKVLRINPGNVATLAAQGYILWLINDLTKAKRKFEEGCNLKAIVTETFIGQLVYGLARILVEQGKINESCDLFRQAITSNPNVGSYVLDPGSLMSFSFYDFMTKGLLTRYQEYNNRLSFLDQNGYFPIGEIDIRHRISLENSELTDELRKSLMDIFKLYLGRISTNFYKDLAVNEISEELDKELKNELRKENIAAIKSESIKNSLMLLSNKSVSVKKNDGSDGWIIQDEKDQNFLLKIFNSGILVGIKFNIEKNVLNTVISYTLNDFGNANLNYYNQKGDDKNYLIAIDNYTEAIKKYKQNYVAKYNKAMALSSRAEIKDSIVLLNEVIENNSTWIEALISFVGMMQQDCLKKLEIAKDQPKTMNNEIMQLNDKEESKGIRSKSDKYIKNQENREEKSETIRRDIRLNEDAEIKSQVDRLNKLKPLLEEIFKTSKLISLYNGLQFDQYQSEKINEFLDLQINWSDLDSDDVRTLRTYALMFNKNILADINYDEQTYRKLSASRRLFNHILTHYYPEDFDISLDSRNLLEKMQKNFLYTPDDHNIRLFEVKTATPLIHELRNNILPHKIWELIIDQDNAYSNYDIRTLKSGNDVKMEVSSKKDRKTKKVYLALKGKTLRGYYSEKDVCSEAINSYIRYWLEQDQTNWLAFTWAQRYLDHDEYMYFLNRAIFSKEEPNPVLTDMAGDESMKYRKFDEAKKYYQMSIEFDRLRPLYCSNMGVAHERLEEWDESITYYKKAIELRRNYNNDPYGFDYYFENLASVYYKKRTIDEFIEILESSEDLRSVPEKKALVYNRVGILFFEENKGTDAIKYYQEAINLDPKAIFNSNIGLVYYNLREWDKSILYYNKAIELRKKDKNDSYGLDFYYENLAKVYYKKNKIGEFIEIFENSLDLYNEPEKKALVYNRIGILFFEENKADEAISYYQKAINLDQKKPIYSSNMALVYENTGDWDKALSYYNKAVELKRNSTDDQYGMDYYYENLAKIYYKKGRIDEFLRVLESSKDLSEELDKKAIVYNYIGILFFNDKKENESLKYYLQASIIDDSIPVYYSNIGMVYESLEDWKTALTYYYKAIELRRNYPSDSSGFDYYYENLAIVAYKQNRIEEFLIYFERSGDFNNEPEKKAIVYNRLGVLSFEDRKEKIALEYYRKAVDYDASKPVYNTNIGLAYEQLGEWENALTFYKKAVELRRNYPNDKYGFDFYYENLARGFYMLGRIDVFIAYFEKSEDFNNDPIKKAIVYNRIGILFYNDGKSKNAEEYYNKAIECDDKKAVFHSNMGLLYADLGQWNKALPYYKKAVELRINDPNDENSLEYYNGLLEKATGKTAILTN